MNEQPPKPIELVFKESGQTAAWACPACGNLRTSRLYGGGPAAEKYAADAASRCCFRFCECGTKLDKQWGYTYCSSCLAKREEERECKRVELAKKITPEEYAEDIVYTEDGPPGSYMGDGFYLLDEILDLCEEHEASIPSYVWACKPISLSLSADGILENAFDNMYENARDSLTEGSEEELQQFLDKWAGKQGIRSWMQDYTTLITLDSLKKLLDNSLV